jgi:hypothetical protein
LKVSKTLGFLRRNLGRCTTKTKATAYTTLVRPVLEYAFPVWDPHHITTTRDIEQVQRRAARFGLCFLLGSDLTESMVSSCSGVHCSVIVGWFNGNQLMVDLVAHYKGLFPSLAFITTQINDRAAVRCIYCS